MPPAGTLESAGREISHPGTAQVRSEEPRHKLVECLLEAGAIIQKKLP